LRVQADALSNLEDIQRLADRLYDAAARHALEATLKLPLPQVWSVALLELIRPPRQVQVLAGSSVVLEGYVKRATLTASGGDAPRTELTLHLSTRYAGDPRN
jgi:hypothetical protein